MVKEFRFLASLANVFARTWFRCCRFYSISKISDRSNFSTAVNLRKWTFNAFNNFNMYNNKTTKLAFPNAIIWTNKWIEKAVFEVGCLQLADAFLYRSVCIWRVTPFEAAAYSLLCSQSPFVNVESEKHARAHSIKQNVNRICICSFACLLFGYSHTQALLFFVSQRYKRCSCEALEAFSNDIQVETRIDRASCGATASSACGTPKRDATDCIAEHFCIFFCL